MNPTYLGENTDHINKSIKFFILLEFKAYFSLIYASIFSGESVLLKSFEINSLIFVFISFKLENSKIQIAIIYFKSQITCGCTNDLTMYE